MTFTTTSRGVAPAAGRAGLPLGALDGVRRRRILALAADFTLVSIMVFGLWLSLLVLTFGLALAVLPPLFPLVAFFYNGLTVAGPSMATPGMRLFDLELRLDSNGQRVPFLNAALHAVLFYFSWMVFPILLVSLFMQDKRCLHDMLAGVIVVRRP